MSVLNFIFRAYIGNYCRSHVSNKYNKMKVAVAILLLALVATALADDHRGGPGGRRGGRGKGKGPGHRGGPPRFGCFSICKDECKDHRRNKIMTCYKPCMDKCDKGDRDCKLECKRTVDCSAEGDETDSSRQACRTCKDSDKFQECVKPFRQCARDNCGDDCPKVNSEDGEKKPRYGLFKSTACKNCLIDQCGHPEDSVKDLEEAMAQED